MAVILPSAALTQLEAASRALLSPHAAPTAEAWIHEAGALVRDLVGGEAVVLAAPGSAIYSTDAPDVAADSVAYVEAITNDGMYFSDPVVNTWHTMRRDAGLEAFSWDINQRMIERHGLGVPQSPIMSDVLMGRRLHEFVGLLKTTPAGDAMVWVLGHRRGGFRFGDRTVEVLQALVPSFRAGLAALAQLAGPALALDTLSEPVAIYNADGRALHRNAALVSMLRDEPESILVEAALSVLVQDVRALAFPRRLQAPGPPPRAEREIPTARGRYTLRATLVPAGALVTDACLVVTVALAAAPRLPEPDALRERFGMTKREAEVATLIAAGLPNDAIADRLFIAPGTARRHTEGVLAKLGVGSRTAVAARLLGASPPA